MPAEEPPRGPEPPERPKLSDRGIICALLSLFPAELDNILSNTRSDTLGSAPVPLRPSDKITPIWSLPINVFHVGKRYYSREVKSHLLYYYDILRHLLDEDLVSALKLEDRQFILKLFRKEKTHSLVIEMLNDFVIPFFKEARKHTDQTIFEHTKRELTDKTFVQRFGYNAIVSGINDEILALIDTSGSFARSPLYLGMPVRYEKKMHPEESLFQGKDTGPLSGEGRIIAFHITTTGAIPDKIVEVKVTGKAGTVTSFLSPEELFFDEK